MTASEPEENIIGNTATEQLTHDEDLGEREQDSLLRCLLQLARREDSACSETTLLAGLPLVDQRLTPELFIRAAGRAGLKAKVVERQLYEIPIVVLPLVLLLDDNRSVVLTQYDVKNNIAIVLNLSSDEEERVALDSLEACYTGYCIYVKAEQRFESLTGLDRHRSAGHWFWGIILSSWRIYRDVCLASLFINLFAIATPLFVMNVYDRVVPNQATATLWVLAVGVVIVYLFDLVLKSLRAYFIELAGKKSDILLSAYLFERVLGAKYSVKPKSVGSFVSQFREFDTVRNFYTSSTIATLVDFPFVVLFLLLIYFIGGSLVWIPLLALPLIIAYGLLLQKPIQYAVEKTFLSTAQKNSTLVEALVGLEGVKVLGAEGFLQRHWEKSLGHLAYWGQRMRILSLSVGLFASLVQQFANVILIIVGVYAIIERELTMGALIAAFMLAARAMAPISQVVNLLITYDQTKIALEALNDVVAKPQERDAEKPFVKRLGFAGNVQFNNVTFHYPDEQQVSLDDVSFNITAGEKVAIIGRIGSGKSTIQKLLLGLYHPQRGSILFDGIDSLQIDPADVRAHVGYVPQDIVLFSGSVKSNIVYGATQVSDNDLIKAASLSGVKTFVNRHPLGFDRPVGERGQMLSGGQRQSIGIARALLNQPAMMILDEPTSGMDNSTETLVKANLQEALEHSTLILVTHKTSLLTLVDRVIVLDNGKLVADGPKGPVLEALKKGQLHVTQY